MDANNSNKTLNDLYFKDTLDLLRQIKKGEATWNDMNRLRQSYGLDTLTIDTLRRNFYMLNEFDKGNWISQPNNETVGTKESVSTDYVTGVTTSDKVVAILPEYINDPKELLKAHGFDPDRFTLISARNSKWGTNTKNGQKTLYSSKISVKPNESNEITFADIDKFFEGLKVNPIKAENKSNIDNFEPFTTEFLEIDLPDLHIGQYSSYNETGEYYDINIAVERIEAAINDIVDHAQYNYYERVVLALLGDILACDNNNHSTTKGTLQDIDGKPYEAFDAAARLLIKVIKKLEEVAPEVNVISVTGNHDNLSGYYLAKTLEAYFNDDSRVTFDITPNPRKAIRYGDVLLGYSHGDMKTNNMLTWLQNDYAHDWGLSKFREIHTGHLHHLSTVKFQAEEDIGGVIIRYLPRISSNSAWEANEGYSNNTLRTIQSFVWDENTGLKEIWYNNGGL